MKEILLVLILMPISILGTTAARMATAECLIISEWVQHRISERSTIKSYTDHKQDLTTGSPKAE
jgi:hypothetical protein